MPILQTTANHHMLSTGLAYPTYNRAPFPDLRMEFTAATEQARASGLGVWASDQTTTGADVTGLHALENDIVIVQKLFHRRRLFGAARWRAFPRSSTRPPTSSSSCPPGTP